MNDVAKNQTVKTMTSLELVDTINEVRRAEGKKPLRHDNFLTKVEKHPGIDSPKFLGEYKDSTGCDLKCYHLQAVMDEGVTA